MYIWYSTWERLTGSLTERRNVLTSYASLLYVILTKYAFSISKLMLPGPSCHQKPVFFILESFPFGPFYDENPTEMASKSDQNGISLACTGPGAPRETKSRKKRQAPAATGAPFGIPFPRHLAHGLSKGGPKGAKRPKRDWKKSIRKAIDFWRSKTLPKASQNHAEMYAIFMFFQKMPKCPKLFVFQ